MQSVDAPLREPATRTPDLGGPLGTEAFAAALTEEIDRRLRERPPTDAMDIPRAFRCLAIPVAAALLATGCFRGVFHVTINRNGSVDADYRAGVFPALSGFVRDKMAAAASDLRSQGFTVSPYAEDRYVGIRARKHFPTDAWRRPVFVSSIAFAESSFRTQAHEDFLYRTLIGRLRVDLTNMKPSDSSQIIFTQDALEAIDVRFILTLPYTPGRSTAAVRHDDGKTLEWRLHPGEVTDITVTARQPRVDHIAELVGLALAAAAAAYLVCLAVRRRAGSPAA